MDWEFQSPSRCQQKGRAALEDSFSLASTPEAGQSPPGSWEGRWGQREGLPLLLFCSGPVSVKGNLPQSLKASKL